MRLLIIFIFSALGFVHLPAQAYEAQDDVLVSQEGKWFRGWVVAPRPDNQFLVAFNWNAGRMKIVPESALRPNTRSPLPADKKRVTGWTSDLTGLWHLATGPQSPYFAAANTSGTIQLFERDTFYPLKALSTSKLAALAMNPTGTQLASCHWDGSVHLYALPGGQLQKKLNPMQHCHTLSWSGTRLAMAGQPPKRPGQQALWIYDTASDKVSAPQLSAASSQRYISALAWSPDGHTLALGNSNAQKGVALYALQGVKLKFLHKLPTRGDVSALSFSPDGQYLVGGGTAGRVNLWKWRSTQRYWSSPWRSTGSTPYLGALQFSPKGQSIAACGMGRGKAVSLYRMGNGKKTGALGETRSMNCTDIVFQRQGQTLYTARQIYSNFGEVVVERYFLDGL